MHDFRLAAIKCYLTKLENELRRIWGNDPNHAHTLEDMWIAALDEVTSDSAE